MNKNYTSQLYYVVIPLIIISISQAGRFITQQGMIWYQTLNFPWFTPPRWVFAPVWSFIFVATGIAAVIVWKKLRNDNDFWYINGLFIINGCLNLLWSYLFFYCHRIGLAAIEAAVLTATIYLLIKILWNKDRAAAQLLMPYAIWSTFAIVLNVAIWWIN